VGSDCGGERAAAIYRLIGTAKLNGLDPQLHLRTILAQIADYPVSRIGQLLPWNLAASLKPTHSAQARFNQLSYVPRRSTNKLNLSHRMSDFITSCIRSLLPFRCLSRFRAPVNTKQAHRNDTCECLRRRPICCAQANGSALRCEASSFPETANQALAQRSSLSEMKV
jgi:hypothetical protein